VVVDVQARDLAASDARLAQVKDAVATWTGQLINLDGRNGLLYYRDLKLGTLDLAEANEVAVDALLSGRTVALSTLFPDSLESVLKRARTVRNKARETLEERGVATLFLAVGMATWTNTRTTATPAAPILLREATIAARGAAEEDFDLALTGEVEFNPTFLHMLAEQHQIQITADELLDELGDGDSAGLFERLEKECSSIPDFGIAERHVLGNFSYAKLPMVADLKANLDALVVHDVVAAIAGDRRAQERLRTAGSDVGMDDPDRTAPADEFLVLDADASQNYAINAAVAGQSLVVKGPPGTGKSQTIANLIASLVARGQRVLFVAEKRAAIAAVLTRLDDVGLADLVLDLHDGVGTKRKVAQNLNAALQASGRVPKPDLRELHARLSTERGKLSAHADALHVERDPWEVSAFDAQCELIDLLNVYGDAVTCDSVLRGSELAALTPEVRRRLCDELREFTDLGGLELTKDSSPWVGANIRSREQAENALLTAHRVARQALPQAQDAVERTLQQIGLRKPDLIDGWRETLGLIDAVAGTLARLEEAVFAAPAAPLAAAVATRKWRKENPAWAGATASWGERRRARKAAKALWHGEGKPAREDLHGALVAAAGQQERWEQLTVDGGRPRLATDLAGAAGAYDQLTRELAALGAFVTSAPLSQLPEKTLESTVRTLAADEATLRKVPRLNELEASLRRAGLGPLLDEIRARRLDAELAVAAFEHCFYASLLSKLSFDDPALANLDPKHHSNTARQFQISDRDHIATSGARVQRAAAERLVQVRDVHPEQARLVAAEAAKKTRHLPLRQLVQAAPDVLTALKPCWAMSPLVVSQLLPGDEPYFDVVIFDEASQIIPADAIPSILRAQRVICAGDEHQLKPTSFFGSSTEDDDEQQLSLDEDGNINVSLTQGYESILDVLRGVLRISQLTWHYRSRDERLIGFSNAWIYDRSLTTFPGPAGDGCLSHVLVEGTARSDQDDSSSEEVAKVVELVLQHATQQPGQSLGVIAMGIKHASRIEAALRAQLRDRGDLEEFFHESREEAFFVKNLERVQGDERDAIILSVGYGKRPGQELKYQFGPLNQDGGQRRLNVAVTRAKCRMTLVSSFSPLDMDPKRSKAEGVKMLRAYLEYAASGGTNLGSVAADKPQLNPFEIDVRDRLVAAGLPLTAQWGVAGYWIDFAAAHPKQPGRMVLAIEADGATYHSSETARDRDRLRQEQLERLGWTFHRIWSTEWFRNPDACVERAKQAWETAVAAADRHDADNGKRRSNPVAVVPEQRAAVTAPAPAQRGPKPKITPGWPITEYSDRELVAVLRWIESDTLLRTENELLAEFMNEFGFRRRGSRIVEAFNSALQQARR
jgi:very-short-patch-repair endonuclease